MRVLAETGAGPIVIAVVVLAMAVTFARSMRARGDFARVREGPLYGGSPDAREPGTAASIADGGQVAAGELLGALAVKKVTARQAASEDEGTGARLGLRRYRARHGTEDLWDPGVYCGTRDGHQVFIRLGRNASVRGPGVNFRRDRYICAVRVAVDAFELVGDEGELRGTTALPPQAQAVLDAIARSPDVWRDLRVVAGPEGLVASRGVWGDWLGGWIYDLWLLERLAAALGGQALPRVRMGREWEPPYGLDAWAPSALGA